MNPDDTDRDDTVRGLRPAELGGLRPAELRDAASPENVRAALAANAEQIAMAGHQHGHGLESVRRATHRGHQIEVRTSYQITVDGRPFDVHVTVDNGGRVHYHGLPTRDFPSVIDLVIKAIDMFPADFPDGQPPDHEHEHEQEPSPDPHGGHEHGGH